MKEAILAFDGVRMMYHTRTKETLAAENMSFSIYEGEFVAVIGPSGCGKTTVLSLAAGLLSPSAGSVCVRGKKVHRGMPCFGYMLQKDELFPWRTVEQNLFLPLEIKKINTPENRKRALALAEKYGVMQAPTLVVVGADGVSKYANASNISRYAESIKK